MTGGCWDRALGHHLWPEPFDCTAPGSEGERPAAGRLRAARPWQALPAVLRSRTRRFSATCFNPLLHVCVPGHKVTVQGFSCSEAVRKLSEFPNSIF